MRIMKLTLLLTSLFFGSFPLAAQDLNVNGADIKLGLSDGRSIGSRLSQRALVHYTSDRLFLNFAGDFEGGTFIGSDVTIEGFSLNHNGADFRLGLNDGRSTGSKKSQRALVHSGSDRLIVNYEGDFEGGTFIQSNLNVSGTTTTSVLNITGGSDLSESFDVADKPMEKVQPGMVLCIDRKNPGKLKLSETAYDRTVAGIVSGAGDVNPGLIMGQEHSIASGEYPVALSGRVYCKVENSNGTITPGDLLTTSSKPGYAMKATDREKAQGAILGKAMTAMEGKEGLVLVLVSLQ